MSDKRKSTAIRGKALIHINAVDQPLPHLVLPLYVPIDPSNPPITGDSIQGGEGWKRNVLRVSSKVRNAVIEELTCRICLALYEDTRTTAPCLHRFCSDCIKKHLRMCSEPTCPGCRGKMPSHRHAKRDEIFDRLITMIRDVKPLVDDSSPPTKRGRVETASLPGEGMDKKFDMKELARMHAERIKLMRERQQAVRKTLPITSRTTTTAPQSTITRSSSTFNQSTTSSLSLRVPTIATKTTARTSTSNGGTPISSNLIPTSRICAALLPRSDWQLTKPLQHHANTHPLWIHSDFSMRRPFVKLPPLMSVAELIEYLSSRMELTPILAEHLSIYIIQNKNFIKLKKDKLLKDVLVEHWDHASELLFYYNITPPH